MTAIKHISTGGTSSGLESRIVLLEKRLALIDGQINGHSDPEGGRLGRLESSMKWLLRLVGATLIASILNLLLKALIR